MCVPFTYSYSATVDAGSTALVGICGAGHRLQKRAVYIRSVCCIFVFRSPALVGISGAGELYFCVPLAVDMCSVR